ncbi:RimK family alpha-L-glutamate ligase [Streptomyces luomodiensis]|uniref:RimK family alpha-L-glutamate ligase n=1 Tax=Streptomyces luomodiensis TaxID=3026192 RepID=A0ABY9UVZ0_9ACTN|nr:MULTISPECIES: RimK family alpha-L-glutamate ligase [unclassified Streptomyces]WAP55135.1 RimK family alpha-L-glutamate ligase [Streptomyces sp. S465]WNE95643.1 RimK family alpha-L-glutamate ligase [Streptomyces sp. SCA4-21]
MTVAATDVLLSVTVLRPDERRLLDALRAQGLTARPVLPPDIAEVLSDETARPEIVLLRNLSHREAIGTARRLEQAGIETLNSPSAIEVCNDKGLQALLFARHGVPHPVTRHAFSYDQVRSAVVELGQPVVVKPPSGSWGRGVTRLADEGELEAWTGGRESADAAGKLFPVLVQEYVDKPGHDLRVVVIGETPVVAFRRKSDNWRTNTHLGAEVERVEITADIERLCALTVSALGPGFYGVDLVEDRLTGELTVLEINANPEFARSSEAHGVDVAGRYAEYVAGLLGSRRLSVAA